MSDKIYTSECGTFSFTLPSEWEEYDSKQDDTYAFFNSKNWSGNLRITPLFMEFDDGIDANSEMTNIVLDKANKIANASVINLGGYCTAHFIQETVEENDTTALYYWFIGHNNTMLICSFSPNDRFEQVGEEIKYVQNILSSLKIK